jgi:hypothetical protein
MGTAVRKIGAKDEEIDTMGLRRAADRGRTASATASAAGER